MARPKECLHFSLKITRDECFSVEFGPEVFRIDIDRTFDSPRPLYLELLNKDSAIENGYAGLASHRIPAGGASSWA